MSDEYSVVSSQSWFSRLGSAMGGILVGVALVCAAFVLLFWNEGRAVKRFKTLEEGGKSVVSVDPGRVDPANEGRLVHVAGPTGVDETLEDPVFGVRVQAVKLRRVVEMYQWKEERSDEKRKKLGGGTETVTTYSYSREWSERHIDSSGFHKRAGHENPPDMPFTTTTWAASRVHLGAFRLSASLIADMDMFQDLDPEGAEPGPQARGARRVGRGYYIGGNPDMPEVGDIRVRFCQVPPVPVSVIAAQHGDTLAPYHARAGGEIELLQPGVKTPQEMIAKAQRDNRLLTWLVRGGGLLLMFIGLRLVLAPLGVLADVVPLFGSVVGAGLSLISALLAGIMGGLTIALAWLAYRPLYGLVLLVPVVVLAVAAVTRLRRAEPPPLPAGTPASSQGGPPPPPPPPPGGAGT